jgi:hypothetical protein
VAPPSRAQIEAALAGILDPSGKNAKLPALLKSDGYRFTFDAPSTGKLTLTWVRASGKKIVLVGSATVTADAAGSLELTIRLTRAGKKLLRGAKREKLTAKASFTPSGAGAGVASRTFTLT